MVFINISSFPRHTQRHQKKKTIIFSRCDRLWIDYFIPVVIQYAAKWKEKIDKKGFGQTNENKKKNNFQIDLFGAVSVLENFHPFPVKRIYKMNTISLRVNCEKYFARIEEFSLCRKIVKQKRIRFSRSDFTCLTVLSIVADCACHTSRLLTLNEYRTLCVNFSVFFFSADTLRYGTQAKKNRLIRRVSKGTKKKSARGQLICAHKKRTREKCFSSWELVAHFFFWLVRVVVMINLHLHKNPKQTPNY